MLVLETKRLRLCALSECHLELLLEDPSRLDMALGLASSAEAMDEHLHQAVEEMRDGVRAFPDEALWSTYWAVELKEERRIVASYCFKGAPNAQGEVEVGYGTAPAYQNRGIITEALGAALDWAFENPRVQAVVAETERDNVASHRVLQKQGMTLFRETSEALWWRKDRGGTACGKTCSSGKPVGGCQGCGETL